MSRRRSSRRMPTEVDDEDAATDTANRSSNRHSQQSFVVSDENDNGSEQQASNAAHDEDDIGLKPTPRRRNSKRRVLVEESVEHSLEAGDAAVATIHQNGRFDTSSNSKHSAANGVAENTAPSDKRRRVSIAEYDLSVDADERQKAKSNVNAFANHVESDEQEAAYQPDEEAELSDEEEQQLDGHETGSGGEDQDATVDVGKYKLRRTSMRAANGGSQEETEKLSLLEEMKRKRESNKRLSSIQELEQRFRAREAEEEASLKLSTENAKKDAAYKSDDDEVEYKDEDVEFYSDPLDEEEKILNQRKRKRAGKSSPSSSVKKQASSAKRTPRRKMSAAERETKKRLNAMTGSVNERDEKYDFDDDEFVADDDEIEYMDDAESGLDDDYYAHIAADRMKDADEAEKRASLIASSKAKEHDESFRDWLRYYGNVLIDPYYSQRVEDDDELKFQWRTTYRTTEGIFRERRDKWVRSEEWNKAIVHPFKSALNSLPYAHSDVLFMPIKATGGCEACNRSHEAKHKITFYGLRYDPERLQHPFIASKLVTGRRYESLSFQVGELCHRRVILYHAMLHFKFHVLASFKTRIDQHIRGENAGESDAIDLSGDSEYDLLDLRRIVAHIVDEDTAFFDFYFKSWEQLNNYSSSFTAQDLRTIRISTTHFLDMQNYGFESKADRLFDYWPEKLRTPKQRERDKTSAELRIKSSHKRQRQLLPVKKRLTDILSKRKQSSSSSTISGTTSTAAAASSSNSAAAKPSQPANQPISLDSDEEVADARMEDDNHQHKHRRTYRHQEASKDEIEDIDSDPSEANGTNEVSEEDGSSTRASPTLFSTTASNPAAALAYYLSLSTSDRSKFLQQLAHHLSPVEHKTFTSAYYHATGR